MIQFTLFRDSYRWFVEFDDNLLGRYSQCQDWMLNISDFDDQQGSERPFKQDGLDWEAEPGHICSIALGPVLHQ